MIVDCFGLALNQINSQSLNLWFCSIDTLDNILYIFTEFTERAQQFFLASFSDAIINEIVSIICRV